MALPQFRVRAQSLEAGDPTVLSSNSAVVNGRPFVGKKEENGALVNGEIRGKVKREVLFDEGNGRLKTRTEKKLKTDDVSKDLEVLWDDGYGTKTVKDYLDGAKDMIQSDGGPPRWFCPVECGQPLKDSPVLLFCPGCLKSDAFTFQCMTAHHLKSFGGCIALAVAARNPKMDIVLILANPGNPMKMAMVDVEKRLPNRVQMEQLSRNLTAMLPSLSGLSDIIPKDTLLWKLKLLKSASAYANSRLHAVKAEVLLLSSGQDNMLPSEDEAKRLRSSLENCKVRYFKDNGHTILLVPANTVVKGGMILSQTICNPADQNSSLHLMKVLKFATGSAMFSTLDDGKIVRGLAGVPNEGPVLIVGYHMLMGIEIYSLVEEFLREKNIVVHGLAHPVLFTGNIEGSSPEFSIYDWMKVMGAVPVTGSNLFKLLSAKSHVLLYPGGAREALHYKGEQYKLFWPDQQEFVRMAARFGATIVPFGAVGEDDLAELVLDYNDLMQIPILNDYIRDSQRQAIRIRDESKGEVANQELFIPGLIPKLPGRAYFLFGKPIETKGKAEDLLKDKEYANEFYLQIKSEVENCMAYLLKKREEDPYRNVIDRTDKASLQGESTKFRSWFTFSCDQKSSSSGGKVVSGEIAGEKESKEVLVDGGNDEGKLEKEVVAPEENLQALWDDGYGEKTVKDFIDGAKEMIKLDDAGPPRWFCPPDCGQPLKDSPGLILLAWALLCTIKLSGRLVKFVEETVRMEHALSPKKPIYILGESFGACLALAVAARNPKIDLVTATTTVACPGGNPFKMAMANINPKLPSGTQVEQLVHNLLTMLPCLSFVCNIIPRDTLLWRLEQLKAAAAYANSRLPDVKAEVLVLSSGLDCLLPSGDEGQRLKSSLENCKVRHFRDNGHTILLEEGLNLLTVIKGTRKYRCSRRHDYVSDYVPPSISEINRGFEDLLVRFVSLATAPAMFSTLDDGKIVRGLAGIPTEGPVLLVGYHMLMGCEILPLIDEILKEKNIMVRGLGHPVLFSGINETITDWITVLGALPVNGSNLFKLLKEKSHVLLYPGGAREALHYKGEAYKLFWPNQQEFVRMAAKFGATIVPFGAVGEDDIAEMLLDYNDLMRIPGLNYCIRESNRNIIRIRDESKGEVANHDLFVPAFLPKVPGRFYYLFGKPVVTKGREDLLKHKENANQLYLQIQSEVEHCMDYLLEKREEDPYRTVTDRLVYRTLHSPMRQIKARCMGGDGSKLLTSRSIVGNGTFSIKDEGKKNPLVHGGSGKIKSGVVKSKAKDLEVFWDDGYGTKTVKDYLDGAKEMIKADGGPPRWFCPVECGQPLNDSPVLLFLPGNLVKMAMDVTDILSKDTLLWKMKLLKSGAAYANSRLHSVNAEVLIVASGKDHILPSGDEAQRLKSLLQDCIVRYFEDNGHTILLEDGKNLLTIMKSTRKYRRSRRRDMLSDFLPMSMSEYKRSFDGELGLYRMTTSSAMFSTLDDGRIVRGLSGVPNEGPVILVGYHMLMGIDIYTLAEEFLREKHIHIRGLAHIDMFTRLLEGTPSEHLQDRLSITGALPATPGSFCKLLSSKSHVLLFPGGSREALHYKGEEYNLFWPDQQEFVRMAARFGATIVPFGTVGEDDIFHLALDFHDLMKIPIINDQIRELIRHTTRIRDESKGEVANQNIFPPVVLPKIPCGRFYFLFGKPVRTKGKEMMLRDKANAEQLYLQIKSQVEDNIAYLLKKREEDPYRNIIDRTMYRALYSDLSEIPVFDL
ncbi:hypothetical protein Tsubulata_037672 [Turnera subulata]|uniref:Serine aminopeptidase S33 domain-containing protein n=1 Tax=Turnera subulata TaxID=218843 RepID=A0A9Q0FSE9_9ROSI|nr:hypothetical protein Tsubulata_037672 [Turnera subulata]